MFCWCKLVSHSPFRPLVHRLRRVLRARADESLHSVTHRTNIFSKTGDFSCFNLWCEFSHFHSLSEQTYCKWLSCLPWSEGKIEMCHFRDLCSRQKQPENIAGLELTTPLRFCRHRWCCQTVRWLFWWSLVKTPCRWQCSFVSHTVKNKITFSWRHIFSAWFRCGPPRLCSDLWVQGFGGELVSPLSLLVIQQHHPVHGAHREPGVVQSPGHTCHFGCSLLYRTGHKRSGVRMTNPRRCDVRS